MHTTCSATHQEHARVGKVLQLLRVPLAVASLCIRCAHAHLGNGIQTIHTMEHRRSGVGDVEDKQQRDALAGEEEHCGAADNTDFHALRLAALVVRAAVEFCLDGVVTVTIGDFGIKDLSKEGASIVHAAR